MEPCGAKMGSNYFLRSIIIFKYFYFYVIILSILKTDSKKSFYNSEALLIFKYFVKTQGYEIRKPSTKIISPHLGGASIRKITHCTSLQKKIARNFAIKYGFPPITAHCYAFQYCPTCFSRKIIINFRQILWFFSRKKIKQQQYQAPLPTSTARIISQEKPAGCFFIMYDS